MTLTVSRNFLLTAFALLVCNVTNAEDTQFTSKVIDLGVVVSDAEASAKFYTEGLGFTELEGFSVPAEFATDVGLTDAQPLTIRVLTLGTGEGSTKLKLMQLPGVKSKKTDNQFIHSQLGVSYLTLFVKDTAAALARLKAIGVKPIAKSPLPLPKGFPEGIYLTLLRDPDGNLIELVGPTKE